MANKRTLIVIAIVAVCVVGYFAFTGFPPTNDGAQGTIGAAQRHQTEQISSEDVVIQDAELQKILQSDEFDRLINSDDFAEVMAMQEMNAVADSREYRAAMEDADFRAAIGHRDLSAFFDRQDVQKAVAEKNFDALNARFKEFAAGHAEKQAEWLGAQYEMMARSVEFTTAVNAGDVRTVRRFIDHRAKAEANARVYEQQAVYQTLGAKYDSRAFADKKSLKAAYGEVAMARAKESVEVAARVYDEVGAKQDFTTAVVSGDVQRVQRFFEHRAKAETNAKYETNARYEMAAVFAEVGAKYDAKALSDATALKAAYGEVAMARAKESVEVAARLYDEVGAKQEFQAALKDQKAGALAAMFESRAIAETNARYREMRAVYASLGAKQEAQAIKSARDLQAAYEKAALGAAIKDADALFGKAEARELLSKHDYTNLLAKPEFGAVMGNRALQDAMAIGEFRTALGARGFRESLAKGEIRGLQ